MDSDPEISILLDEIEKKIDDIKSQPPIVIIDITIEQ